MGSLLLTLIYICFVSLGLPDSLLGSAWPVMHAELGVPVSFAGVLSMTIFVGTILSSLYSDRLLHKFGAGRVTAVSVAMTAVALFGFSISFRFWMLLLWSIPYGLGAGAIDAILNNYVALHYKAQHMSWLHCMWGLGASVSPYIMGFALTTLDNWSYGYLIVAVIQILLSLFIFFSTPLWKKGGADAPAVAKAPLSFREIFTTPGVVPCFITFFTYCSLEVTASLWASSYLVEIWSFTPEAAASFASMFYIGITCGRFANGFLAMKWQDRYLIRLGLGVTLVGILLLFLPFHATLALAGFAVIGLGCAPIYPCIMHMTPTVFGEDKSQAMMGVQTAFAYTGCLVAPTLFGMLAERVSISLLPLCLLLMLLLMLAMHETVVKKAKK